MSLPAASRAALAGAEAFWRAERPWLLWRALDEVLIVPPNRVYKLGGAAPRLVSWLEAGGRLAAIPGMDQDRARETAAFFHELAKVARGGEPSGPAFGRVPYGFDFTRLPVLGELALTYRCNARCRFCYASCGAGIPGRELTTREALKIIRVFREEAKIPFFSFTGGEPLLRDDLEELAAHARSLGLRTNLITNASLATPARARALKAAGIDTAQASLESPDAAVHDALCDVEGAFDRTVAGIGALMGAGIRVQTNTTLTALNRDSLQRLPAFLEGIGVRRFSMNLFIPSGRGIGDGELLLPYAEAGAVVDSVRAEARARGLDFLWYSPTPYCLYNPVARGLGNKSCAAADGLIHVNPAGEVLPCSSWQESLGSLLERPFAEIWFSERAAFFKNKSWRPAACAECGAFVACQGACPLYLAAVGDAEILAAREAAGPGMPGHRGLPAACTRSA